MARGAFAGLASVPAIGGRDGARHGHDGRADPVARRGADRASRAALGPAHRHRAGDRACGRRRPHRRRRPWKLRLPRPRPARARSHAARRGADDLHGARASISSSSSCSASRGERREEACRDRARPCGEALRRPWRRRRHVAHDRGAHALRLRRPLGLRQIDDASPDQRADPARRRRDPHRRAGHRRHQAGDAAARHRLCDPVDRPLPALECRRQHRDGAAPVALAQGPDRSAHRRASASLAARACRIPGEVPASALGRPAAACRRRARARGRPQDRAHGRALRRARPADARGAARGDPPHPGARRRRPSSSSPTTWTRPCASAIASR